MFASGRLDTLNSLEHHTDGVALHRCTLASLSCVARLTGTRPRPQHPLLINPAVEPAFFRASSSRAAQSLTTIDEVFKCPLSP